jgi:hypothetical protein
MGVGPDQDGSAHTELLPPEARSESVRKQRQRLLLVSVVLASATGLVLMGSLFLTIRSRSASQADTPGSEFPSQIVSAPGLAVIHPIGTSLSAGPVSGTTGSPDPNRDLLNSFGEHLSAFGDMIKQLEPLAKEFHEFSVNLRAEVATQGSNAPPIEKELALAQQRLTDLEASLQQRIAAAQQKHSESNSKLAVEADQLSQALVEAERRFQTLRRQLDELTSKWNDPAACAGRAKTLRREVKGW